MADSQPIPPINGPTFTALERGQRALRRREQDAGTPALPGEESTSVWRSSHEAEDFGNRIAALGAYAGPAIVAPLLEAWQRLAPEYHNALRALSWAEDEAARLRRDVEAAEVLVARMHQAAVGEIRGPVFGVVADVRRLRSAASRALTIATVARRAGTPLDPSEVVRALDEVVQILVGPIAPSVDVVPLSADVDPGTPVADVLAADVQADVDVDVPAEAPLVGGGADA